MTYTEAKSQTWRIKQILKTLIQIFIKGTEFFKSKENRAESLMEGKK